MIQKISNLLRDKRGAKYFTFKEVIDGCLRHNFVALNASIAFFTLFAMVPFNTAHFLYLESVASKF